MYSICRQGCSGKNNMSKIGLFGLKNTWLMARWKCGGVAADIAIYVGHSTFVATEVIQRTTRQ